jgi:5-methylcytosine-specific restriction endonuclease McrA
MPIMPRLCIQPGCGRIIERGSRCTLHAIPPVSRHRRYRTAAARVIATATICAICGKPATADDPFVVDHRLPRAHGGTDDAANLQACHRSCNSKKGATIRW